MPRFPTIMTAFLGGLGLMLLAYNPLAEVSREQMQQVTVSAGILAGSLKVGNAAVSVAKSATFGAGISFSPFEMLEPVTDTIDRAANFLFGLMIVSGILTLTSTPMSLFGALAMAVGAGLLLILERYRKPSAMMSRFAHSILTLGIVTALLIPSSFAVSGWLGERLTRSAYEDAKVAFGKLEALEKDELLAATAPDENPATSTVSSSTPPVVEGTDEAGGIFSSAREGLATAYDTTSNALSNTAAATGDLVNAIPRKIAAARDRVAAIAEAATDLPDVLLSLAIAYLLEIVFLPVLMIASLIFVLRQTFDGSGARRGETVAVPVPTNPSTSVVAD